MGETRGSTHGTAEYAPGLLLSVDGDGEVDDFLSKQERGCVGGENSLVSALALRDYLIFTRSASV